MEAADVTGGEGCDRYRRGWRAGPRARLFSGAQRSARSSSTTLTRRLPTKSPRKSAQTGGEALAIAASVTDEVAIGAMVEQTLSKWGRVDILVNNAGILRDKSFAKMSSGGLPAGGRSPFDGGGDLHESGVGHHARAAPWPHDHDDLVVRPLRQLRPGQLWRREDGVGRADADARHRGREIRHPCQLPGPDRRDPDDARASCRAKVWKCSIRRW